MVSRYNRRWGIDPSLIEDMETVFSTTTALVATLNVTTPTWKRITKDDGVKETTALKIVKEYFLLLRSMERQERGPEGTYRIYGLDMLEKYREDIVSHRFGKFVRPLTDAGSGVAVKERKSA